MHRQKTGVIPPTVAPPNGVGAAPPSGVTPRSARRTLSWLRRPSSLLLLLGMTAADSPVLATDLTAKPNVVIIIADDLAWHDVASFGGPTDAKTPHLDRLASEGVKLTGFFAPAAVCSPVRQALLTGMYPVRSGAYPNHSRVRAGTRSLPHHLAQLGYSTALAGKKHFGPPASYPFEVEMPMLGEENGGQGANRGEGDVDLAAMDAFIRSSDPRPFCLYVAPHEPHGPWTKGPQPDYDPATLKLPPHLVDTPETRRSLARYYAEVSFLDSMVGEVLRILQQTGRAEDTLLLFFSEQGNSLPQGKWTLYDAGIRVAAIARWPGRIEPGTSNAALVQYVDVLPTLIQAAGGDPKLFDTGCPDANGALGFDGRSFLDVLTGRSHQHRDYVFAQHTARGIIDGPEAYGTRAVRDGRWKLIVNLHADTPFSNVISNGEVLQSWTRKGEAGDGFALAQARRYTVRPAVELYDLDSDPWELTDIAADPANHATVTRLRAELDAWMQQQGDEGDRTEREAHLHQEGNRINR